MKTKILLVGGFEETRYLAHSLLEFESPMGHHSGV